MMRRVWPPGLGEVPTELCELLFALLELSLRMIFLVLLRIAGVSLVHRNVKGPWW